MGRKRVVARPTPEQFERWEEEKGDLSWTQLVSQAVEGWLKPFGAEDIQITDDDTTAALRAERNGLRDELAKATAHIDDLERQLNDTEAREIDRFGDDNPDANLGEIIEHVRATAPSRVADHLDVLPDGERRGALMEAEIEVARAADERAAIEEKGIERVVAEDYPDDMDIDDAYSEHEVEDLR